MKFVGRHGSSRNQVLWLGPLRFQVELNRWNSWFLTFSIGAFEVQFNHWPKSV